jgi:hypothetical protein
MGGATRAPIWARRGAPPPADEHVGQERPMGSVLLGGAGRNDDRVTTFQEFLDFRVGHLAEKYGGRLHQDLVRAHPTRELIVTDSIIWSDGDELIEMHYIGLDSLSPAVRPSARLIVFVSHCTSSFDGGGIRGKYRSTFAIGRLVGCQVRHRRFVPCYRLHGSACDGTDSLRQRRRNSQGLHGVRAARRDGDDCQ